MQKITKNSNKGFTLIELLVVIAIIALLLSILMPALSKVKEQAKIVVCTSNLSQAGKGVYTYATEFDGYLPPMLQYHGTPPSVQPGTSVGNYVNQQGFGLLVAEPYGWSGGAGYLPNAESLICPADKEGNHVSSGGEVLTREKNYFFGNIVMSYTYIYATPFDKAPSRLLWHEMLRYRLEKTESKAVILFEKGYWGDDLIAAGVFNPPMHKNGMNVLHVDGRAHFTKGKVLAQQMEEEELKTTGKSYWYYFFRSVDNM